MAGTVVHLLVAMELLAYIQNTKTGGDWGQGEKGLFVAGNVSPDAIHEREDYTREMKMITHLREGIRDAYFHLPENLAVFHQRVEAFAERELQRKNPEYALYLGYITHLLTDEYFMRTVREEYMEAMERRGLTQKDKETFERFTFDVNQIDYRLLEEHAETLQVAEQLLRQTMSYHIEGILSENELTKSRKWILLNYFGKKWCYFEPIDIRYERMERFCHQAADFCIRYLRGIIG